MGPGWLRRSPMLPAESGTSCLIFLGLWNRIHHPQRPWGNFLNAHRILRVPQAALPNAVLHGAHIANLATPLCALEESAAAGLGHTHSGPCAEVEIISSFRSSLGFSCENGWHPWDLTMLIYLLSSAGLLSGTFGTWGFKH